MSTKFIYLVRHGQYDPESNKQDPGEGHLTALGRQQAGAVAKRLAIRPITAIYSSKLHRARETAAIIQQHFPKVEPEITPILRECTPCVPPDHAHLFTKYSAAELAQDKQQAIDAFTLFFQLPAAEDEAQHIVLATHGNLIRYFVSRVLKLPVENWLNMASHNCGLTQIILRPDGRRRLVSFNDLGHLTAAQITHNLFPIEAPA